MKKTKSPENVEIGFLERMLEKSQEDFVKETENLAWIMKNGGGIKNIHIDKCLRNLSWLYETVAAQSYALLTVKGGLYAKAK